MTDKNALVLSGNTVQDLEEHLSFTGQLVKPKPNIISHFMNAMQKKDDNPFLQI